MEDIKGLARQGTRLKIKSMIVELKEPGMFEIVETDPAWEAVLSHCQNNGSAVIQTHDGQIYQLQPRPKQEHRRHVVTEFPDFAARRQVIASEGLTPEGEAEFSRLLRSE